MVPGRAAQVTPRVPHSFANVASGCDLDAFLWRRNPHIAKYAMCGAPGGKVATEFIYTFEVGEVATLI